MLNRIFTTILVFSLLLIPSVLAQTAIEPVCSGTCLPDDCYAYDDCQPLKGTCKIGNCCEGKCTIVPVSTDEKVNYISDQLVDIKKKMEEEITMSVFGTEYQIGDDGTTFLELLDNNHNPITDASCVLNVWYPDKNSKFMDKQPMDYLENGIYYVDFYVPDQLGVYILDAYCFYSDEKYEFTRPYSVVTDGYTFEGYNTNPENLYDMDCLVIYTTNGTYMEFQFNDSEIGNINIFTITSIHFYSRLAHEEINSWEVWNFTSGSWYDTLYNTSAVPVGGMCNEIHTDSFILYNNLDDFVSGDEIRFRMVSEDNMEMYVDDVGIIFSNNGSYVDDIRGAGEIHVNDYLIGTMIALWGENMGWQPSYQMVGLGITGFLTGNTNAFCSDNMTLTTIKNEVVNVSGRLINVDRTVNDNCVYGCSGNMCSLPDFAIYAFLIFVLVLVYIGYRHFFD